MARWFAPLLNLVLEWNVVPSAWKLSHVVPVFKHGDASDPDQYRPISIAPCAFKIFERLVHGKIAPRICSGLDECQGGFRWGADAHTCGLVDTLRLRHDQHTFARAVAPGWRDRGYVANHCQFPLHAERSHLLGLIPALCRDGCSRHFC